ncbi:MAG: hypothetical protein IJF08_09405 [Clostridia bacterium]|nr:hypothetical protein [Clostridia bacterium]
MNVGQIISIAVTVLLVVLGLIFVLRGLRRGWVKALMTTGNLVLSAFLACFLSRDFTTISRDYVYPLFLWFTGLFGLSLEERLADFEEILALMPLFVGVIITPLLFLVFFAIFRAIIGFVLMFFHRSKKKTVNEEGETVRVKRHVSLVSRLIGGAIGMLNAALLLAILLLPVSGYTNLICNVRDAYFESLATSEYSREGTTPHEIVYFAVQDYVDPITENWFIKASYGTLGRPMFTHMTKTVYHESELGLENEAIVATKLIKETVDFTSADFKGMTAQRVEKLHTIVDTLGDSVLMPELMASLISELCDNWANGEALYGIDRPALGELLDPTFDVLLDLLATLDRHTLVADLETLTDILDMLVEHKIFENLGDSNKLMDILSKNSDLIGDLRKTFEKNEHLAPMSEEIKRLCVRAVTQSLDMENLELTGKLTDSINSYKDQPEQLGQELGIIVRDFLEEQNISATVSNELTEEMAHAISREFAGQDQVTEEEVIDFVLNYASGNLADENGNIDLDGDGIPDGNVDDAISGGADFSH